jgi:hypothetical protein
VEEPWRVPAVAQGSIYIYTQTHALAAMVIVVIVVVDGRWSLIDGGRASV